MVPQQASRESGWRLFGPPRASRRRSALRLGSFLALGAGLGLALSVAGYVSARASERRESQARFERAAANRVAALEVALAHIEDDLAALGGFLAVSNSPDRSEFGALASRIEKRHPGTQALEWIPRIPDSEREGFERSLHAEGLGLFQITERRARGAMERAGRRGEYYPVFFVEPFEGNEIALGYDLASDETRRAAIRRAVASGEAAASGRVTLVQERGDQYGVLVFQPVYQRWLPGPLGSPRTLLGFALGVYRVGDLLEQAVNRLAPEPVAMDLLDASAPPAEQYLASLSAGRVSRAAAPGPAGARPAPFEAAVHLSDREWKVRCFPEPGSFEAQRSPKPLLVLLSGLVVTVLLVAVALLMAKVAGRESDRQFRVLLDRLSLGAVVLDGEGTVLYCNDRLLELLGRGRQELEGADFFETCVPKPRREAERTRLGSLLRGEAAAGEEEMEIERGGPGGEARVLGWTSTVLAGPRGVIVAICSDITERRRALANQRFLATLVEHMQEAVVALDEALVVKSWSKGAELIYGWPAAEAIGRTACSLFRPDASEEEQRAFEARLAARETDRVVAPHLRKEGRPIVVEANYAALKDGDGRRTGFLAVCRDVSEQKVIEGALRESEQRFRAIFEQAAVGIAQADVHTGRFLRVNDKLCEIVGYPREDLLRLSWQDLTHAEDLPSDRESYARMLESHRPYSKQKRYQRKDGRPVWVNVSVAPMWPPEADPSSHVSVVEDVTAAKQAAEALRESEERFRIAFETSPDAVNINRLDDGLFVAVNEGFTRMTGWRAEEALGRSSLELPVWDDPADRERLVAGLKADGYVQNLEAQFRRKDGKVLAGLMSARLIHLRGERYLLSITRDITEWRRLEQERDRLRSDLHQVAKMEAIGQLAGGVAHDFNNLLTVILSGAEALKSDLSANALPEPEIVEEIANAGRRARDLTRQLLAFARRQVIAPVPLDLNGLSASIEKLLRRVLGEDIELAMVGAPGLWPVRCDPGQIEQVILNLAVNARDAMPEGGRLTLETRNVEVDEQLTSRHPFMRAGPYVRLTISDSGQGMSPEVKAHAFEPFFTTKPVGRGTGLGLATVYGIVKQSEGYILLESEPGQGTSFQIYLPRIAEPAVAVEAPPGVAPGQGSETVLVAEDDPQVRNVTVRSLRSGGYTVLVAEGGREAIELGRRTPGPLHLLVTDVVMPGLDGRSVAEALRPGHPEMRVLYVSGHAEEAIVERGVLEPGLEFLPKPFTVSSLLAKVRAILDAARGRTDGAAEPATWSDRLATGVRQIDLEHRELFANTAALGEAMRQGHLPRALDILAYLETYAARHFEAEERHMQAAAYPQMASHRSAHRAFAAELARRRAEYQAHGSRAAAMVELHDWLRDWLKAHVAGEDAEMARHLQGKALSTDVA